LLTKAPMVLLIAVASGIISGIAATALTLRVLERFTILDVPNQRSSHTRPTLRGGGIGLAAGTLVALAIAQTNLVGSTWMCCSLQALGSAPSASSTT